MPFPGRLNSVSNQLNETETIFYFHFFLVVKCCDSKATLFNNKSYRSSALFNTIWFLTLLVN